MDSDRDRREVAQDFADVERMTRTVLRGAAAFALASPIWLLLLLVLPALGAAPLGSFMIATVAAAFLAWAGLRWIAPRRREARAAGRPVAPPGARRALLVGVGVVVLLYLAFVLRAGG